MKANSITVALGRWPSTHRYVPAAVLGLVNELATPVPADTTSTASPQVDASPALLRQGR